MDWYYNTLKPNNGQLNMKTIAQNIIDKSQNYTAYREMIDTLFAENKTTGENQSKAMLHYTHLNITRMKRLEKTTKLTEATLTDLKNIEKPLRLLVLTEAWCGDAAQIVPVLDKMATMSENLELKVILRDENLEVMDAFLTNGGRSIPKIIVLDKATNDVLGSWGPRPHEVQTLLMDAKKATNPDMEKIKTDIQRWYAKDKTKSIQSEFLDTIKAALA